MNSRRMTTAVATLPVTAPRIARGSGKWPLTLLREQDGTYLSGLALTRSSRRSETSQVGRMVGDRMGTGAQIAPNRPESDPISAEGGSAEGGGFRLVLAVSAASAATPVQASHAGSTGSNPVCASSAWMARRNPHGYA